LDGEMNLLPQGVAIAELEGDDVSAADRTELTFDADLLMSEGRRATGLKRFIAADVGGLIESVDLEASDTARGIMVRGERAKVSAEMSPDLGEVRVSARAG